MRRSVVGMAACAALLGACGGPLDDVAVDPASEVSSALTGSFTAIADASVKEASPAQNFGGPSALEVDQAPSEHAYFRFAVQNLSGSVTGARLRLFVSNGSTNGPKVFSTGNTWSEASVTWNNKPAPAATALADIGSAPAGAWLEVDVSRAVTGNGVVNLVLIPDSTDGFDVASRESANAPQLIVTTGSTPPPGSSTETLIVQADADAFVTSTAPTRNFGVDPALVVDASPDLRALLRFNVATSKTIRSAKVRLFVTNGSSAGPTVHDAEDAWREEWVTWSTQPAFTLSPVATIGSVSAGTVELDVTSLVKGPGTYSLLFKPRSTDGFDFASRESASGKPTLVLTVDAAQPPPPPPSCVERVDRTEGVWTASEDTYASAEVPTTNYRYATSLMADASPANEAYLRWPAVLTSQQKVTSAKLRVWVTNGTSNGPTVSLIDSETDFAAVTWNNRPPITSGVLANFGAMAAGGWAEVDVTAAFQGSGRRAFALTGDSTDGVGMTSLEGGFHPHVVFTLETQYCERAGTGGTATGWARQHGDYPLSNLSGAASGPDGSFIAWGSTVDYPDRNQPYPPGTATVARFTSAGELRWYRLLPKQVQASGGAVSEAGNILLVGNYSGAPDFGGGPVEFAEPGRGFFLLKLTPEGAFTWVRTFKARDSDGDGHVNGMISSAFGTDRSGSFLFSGFVTDTVDFDGEAVTRSSFVGKVDWTGKVIWARASDGVGVRAITSDDADHVVIGGELSAGSSFDDGWTSATDQAFTASLDATTGQTRWIAPLGAWGSVDSLARNPRGELIASGWYRRSGFSFAGSAIPAPTGGDSDRDVFVLKYRADGTPVWGRRYGSPKEEYTGTVVTDAAGNIGLHVWASSATDLGGGEVGPVYDRSEYQDSSFVAQYDDAGQHLWSRFMHHWDGVDHQTDIVPLANGSIGYVTILAADWTIDGRSYDFTGSANLLILELRP